MKMLSAMRVLTITWAIFPSLIHGASVDVGTASKVATAYHSAYSPQLHLSTPADTMQRLQDTLPLLDDSGRIVAYVKQFPEGGYVVTAADNRIEPIVMQSFTGTFPVEKPNPVTNFIVWDIAGRLHAIDAYPAANKDIVETNKGSWESLSSGDEPIQPLLSTWGPLISTYWDQGGRFNDKCPYKVPYTPALFRRPVGCSATALSQLINFWKYPKSIYLSYSEDQYEAEGIDFDGDANKYGFPNFVTLNSELESIAYDDSDDEVANLNFAVGLKLESSYSAWSTSASPSDFDNVLLNDFGYGSARFGHGSWASHEATAIKNVKAGQPLVLAIMRPQAKTGHAVLLDGYRDTDDFFHVNWGWGSGPSTAWYNLPSAYDGYDTIYGVIYDISTYYGWQQYGGDQHNRFRTVYGVPATSPHVKYTRSTRDRIQGLIIGEGNWIFTTHNPEIINSTYHPRIVAVDQYGSLVHDKEITQSTRTISEPVQAPNGDVFFGTDDGVYRFRPQSGIITRVFYDPGNTFYGDSTPRVDDDGYMYFGNPTTLVSLNQYGIERWRWSVPSGGVMYTGVPSIDSVRENVYVGYWKDSTDEAILVCINRTTGVTRYLRTFPSIPSADRGIHTPAVASDGTVYASVRTEIYALTPSASSFSEKWVVDKLYARHQPIAVGADDSVYTEYWTQSGSSWYLTLAKLNSANGDVIWEKAKPDVGTYSYFSQPIVTGNGIVLFPVHWDSSPNDTWQLYAYTTAGEFLWDYSYSPASVYDIAVASSETLCLAKKDGSIVALSDGTVGDPRSGGMGFTNNSSPAGPTLLTPTNLAIVDSNTVQLSWSCSDPDDHNLTYDIFLGKMTDSDFGGMMVPIMNGTSATSIMVSDLAPGSTYSWVVQATDGQSFNHSAVYSFTVQGEPLEEEFPWPMFLPAITGAQK